jgi:hypothetical protein
MLLKGGLIMEVIKVRWNLVERESRSVGIM